MHSFLSPFNDQKPKYCKKHLTIMKFFFSNTGKNNNFKYSEIYQVSIKMIKSTIPVHTHSSCQNQFISQKCLLLIRKMFIFLCLVLSQRSSCDSTKWTKRTTFNICNLNAINFLSPLIPVDCSTFSILNAVHQFPLLFLLVYMPLIIRFDKIDELLVA